MFAISEFAAGEGVPELRCVLKRLYSDFIVVEIPASGQVMSPKTAEEEEKEEEDEEGQKLEKEEKPEKLTDEELNRMKRVADGEEEQCVLSLKDWTKEERKCLHRFISTEFGHSRIQSGCGNGLLTVRHKAGKNNTPDLAPRRSNWPKGRGGDFLHFTMCKQNWDSQAALHQIARALKSS